MPVYTIKYQQDQEEFSELPGVNVLMFSARACAACQAARPELISMSRDLNFNVGFVEITDPKVTTEGVEDVPYFIVYKHDDDPIEFNGFRRRYLEGLIKENEPAKQEGSMVSGWSSPNWGSQSRRM